MPIKGMGKKTENLVCIGIDGRNHKDTLLYKEIVQANGEKTLKKSKGPERHLTVTQEKLHLFWKNLTAWLPLRLFLLITPIQI